MTAIQEAIRSYREITVMGRRRGYIEQFRGQRWKVAASEADLRLVNIVTKYIYEVALVIGGGLLAGFLFSTRETPEALAVLAIFIAAASRLLPSVMRLQTATFTVRASSGEARAAVELHDELSSHSAQLTLATDLVLQTIAGIKSDHANFTGEVSMRDITLQYPDAPRPALRNVTCTIQAGTTVAIVGTTGSGKSTLADVILGVLSPDEGSVIVNGRAPMEAIQLWPGAIAYVPQEVALIEGSVRDNVALGLPRDYVEDALVWSALQRAHLADFLRETRSGLDTRVGEGGFRLSGGQRQRLGLARALYTRPRLLVLDEATSSLDSETENFITMSLAQLDKHVTKIVIAHRLATIRDADQVIYLEGGEVRAIGSFDALLQEVPDFLNQARLLGLA
jgi:ABC-type multidrug transport system fused ATPase/permease subunit